MPFDEAVAEPVATEITDVSTETPGDLGAGTETIDPGTMATNVDQSNDPGAAAAEVDGDGRQIPSWLRSTIDQLKQTDPKAANTLRTNWFAELTFKKEFPGGLNEARALREFRERLGGEEGYKQLEAERKSYKDLDAQFAAGDPKAIEHLATVAPEGLSKLITPALQKLSETHPEQFKKVTAQLVLSTLPQFQFPTTDGKGTNLVGAIHLALNSNPETAWLAQYIADWYNPLVGNASKEEQKAVDPARQKLDEDVKQFESRKTQEFQKGLVDEMEMEGGKQSDTLIDKLSGGKLSAEAKSRLKNVIASELDTTLRSDSSFIEKRDRLLAEGDRTKILTNFKTEFTKRLPEIVKKVYREFYGTSKPATTPNVDVGTGRGAQPGKQPDASTIDWTRTSRRDVLDGKAYVKGQTAQVTW